MVFTHYTLTKMVLGAIMIGAGFGVPSLIYRVESVPDPIKVLIHMGVGLTIYLCVAFYEGWLGLTHLIFSLFIQIGSCFLIYALFVSHYQQEARTFNAALQKKKQD